MSTFCERPILFTGEMVRAILAGQKTQTRRLVKGASGAFWDHAGWTPTVWRDGIDWTSPGHAFAMSKRCPYGAPGDRLWVRETWKQSEYSCDDEQQPEYHECSAHCSQTYVYYAATPRVGFRAKPDQARIAYLDDSSPLTEWYTSGWRPSIHMPRWASRLTLEVADVRVERLQSMSEKDARREGVKHVPFSTIGSSSGYEGANGLLHTTATQAFADLWDRLNSKRAPWASNPWVWVVAFRRLEAS